MGRSRSGTAADAWRPTSRNAVGVAVLRKLLASFAARLRRSRHSLGSRRFERCSASACPLHGLRLKGSDAPASRLGRRRCRLPAVPRRSGHLATKQRSLRRSTAAGSGGGCPWVATRRGLYLHCLSRAPNTSANCFPSSEFGSTSSSPSIIFTYSGPIC
jgi:hypothetical protein